MRVFLAFLVLALTLPIACASPEPTTTPNPTPTQPPTAISTTIPTETPTPLPTFTPTPTLAPTPTPEPTATPTPLPTATPEPQWEATGYWYHDVFQEAVLTESLKGTPEGETIERARVATLDADSRLGGGDLYLSLVCFDSIPVAYLFPYDVFPPDASTYAFGIYDYDESTWEEGGFKRSIVFTDDASGAVLMNRVEVREIIRLLQLASVLPSSQVAGAVFYDGISGDVVLAGSFNPTGLAGALDFLGCME